MRQTSLEALEAQLHASPPAGLASLAESELRDLTEAVRAARARQADQLAAAGENALRFIPRLLRGPIRKVVGG